MLSSEDRWPTRKFISQMDVGSATSSTPAYFRRTRIVGGWLCTYIGTVTESVLHIVNIIYFGSPIYFFSSLLSGDLIEFLKLEAPAFQIAPVRILFHQGARFHSALYTLVLRGDNDYIFEARIPTVTEDGLMDKIWFYYSSEPNTFRLRIYNDSSYRKPHLIATILDPACRITIDMSALSNGFVGVPSLVDLPATLTPIDIIMNMKLEGVIDLSRYFKILRATLDGSRINVLVVYRSAILSLNFLYLADSLDLMGRIKFDATKFYKKTKIIDLATVYMASWDNTASLPMPLDRGSGDRLSTSSQDSVADECRNSYTSRSPSVVGERFSFSTAETADKSGLIKKSIYLRGVPSAIAYDMSLDRIRIYSIEVSGSPVKLFYGLIDGGFFRELPDLTLDFQGVVTKFSARFRDYKMSIVYRSHADFDVFGWYQQTIDGIVQPMQSWLTYHHLTKHYEVKLTDINIPPDIEIWRTVVDYHSTVTLQMFLPSANLGASPSLRFLPRTKNSIRIQVPAAMTDTIDLHYLGLIEARQHNDDAEVLVRYLGDNYNLTFVGIFRPGSGSALTKLLFSGEWSGLPEKQSVTLTEVLTATRLLDEIGVQPPPGPKQDSSIHSSNVALRLASELPPLLRRSVMINGLDDLLKLSFGYRIFGDNTYQLFEISCGSLSYADLLASLLSGDFFAGVRPDGIQRTRRGRSSRIDVVFGSREEENRKGSQTVQVEFLPGRTDEFIYTSHIRLHKNSSADGVPWLRYDSSSHELSISLRSELAASSSQWQHLPSQLKHCFPRDSVIKLDLTNLDKFKEFIYSDIPLPTSSFQISIILASTRIADLRFGKQFRFSEFRVDEQDVVATAVFDALRRDVRFVGLGEPAMAANLEKVVFEQDGGRVFTLRERLDIDMQLPIKEDVATSEFSRDNTTIATQITSMATSAKPRPLVETAVNAELAQSLTAYRSTVPAIALNQVNVLERTPISFVLSTS